MNEIKIIGIIGSGKMGSDLFNYLSDFNFQLVWFTRNLDHKQHLTKTFQKKIKRQLKHGIITHEVFDFKNRYKITDCLEDLENADLIIESVIEEKEIKQELFKKLDQIVKPSCILASNSSSVLPSELSEVKRPNRILGIHFFFPIAFKNVVELIASELTDEITIEKTRIFLKEIKRFFIEQNEKGAFILNRFLLQLQIEAYNLIKQYNLAFNQLDEVSKELVPEFGLFEIMDHVGHYTMFNAVMNYSRMDKDKKKYEPLMNELQNRAKNTGKQKGHLFYDEQKEWAGITQEAKQEIIDTLSETAKSYYKQLINDYELNPYPLKKALEEYCGIVL